MGPNNANNTLTNPWPNHAKNQKNKTANLGHGMGPTQEKVVHNGTSIENPMMNLDSDDVGRSQAQEGIF